MTHDLDWELRLGFLLHDVSRLRRNVVDRALKPLGVTRSQWWVLAFLSRRDGIAQVTLAHELDLGKVALGGLIDRLETAGLLERRGDREDRRIKRVFLTPTGVGLLTKIRVQVKDTEDVILDGISGDHLAAAVVALRAMKVNLLTQLDQGRIKEPTSKIDRPPSSGPP